MLRSPKWPQMAGSASTAKPGSVAFRESAKPGKDHLDINIIFRDQDKDGRHIHTKTKTKATKRKAQAKKESGVKSPMGKHKFLYEIMTRLSKKSILLNDFFVSRKCRRDRDCPANRECNR